MGEEVPAHAVLSLGVAGHGLNGGAASELALNGCSDAALLSLPANFELMLHRSVVAYVSRIRQDSSERGSGRGLDTGKHGLKRMPVSGLPSSD